ncbi:hypothetical protein SCHPADRAFT_868643 [Schizopora paradoxa]|uniref:Uncharacterized protein n=1 Tax=Schizopora paradoxa TaxID=27342 RepID=A0A0H2SJ72_9AGAM|nr:hypothetical protein SCHPADRAFT_868643 [Schizopora paradoxa]
MGSSSRLHRLDEVYPGRTLKLLLACLAITTVLNILLLLLVDNPPEYDHNSLRRDIDSSNFTFIGDDFPREYPLPAAALGPVALTVEDSVNFQLDTSQGAAQWRAIIPSGGGYVTLGPEQRRFRLSMFHALDCLNTVRENVLYRKTHRDIPASSEAQFCLSYIRQMIQCRADTQLESVRSEYGGKSVQPFYTHNNCRDWSIVYNELTSFHMS